MLVAVVAALLMPAAAMAGDFYISPDGDDANPGTIEQPFASLDRARLAVRAQLAGGISEDVFVYLRGGVYRVTSPIVFDSADSAPSGLAIHYAAYANERPVISGGRVIDGWMDQGDGTWSATIPDVAAGNWTFRELYVNGRRRTRARHPNSGFLNVAGPNPGVGTNTRVTFAYGPGDLPAGEDLSGAELNVLHEWTTSRVDVASMDLVGRTLTTATPIGATGIMHSIFQWEDHPRYALENHPALLDAAGEWYLDEESGLLTYRPMSGEFVESVEAVAPMARELLVVRGEFDDGTSVRNLRFEGLAFEHSAWALPPGGYASYQSGYYEQRGLPTYELPAAVKFEVAEGCDIVRARVAHCGGWGVMLGAWCRDCSLVGSIVTDVAGNGVIVGEDRYRRVADFNYWVTNDEDQVAIDNTVVSNVMQDCGVVFQDAAGVWVGLTEKSKIQNNLIRRMPHIGISTGGFWDDRASPAREIMISGNRIQNVVQLLADGAGIYSVGLQPDSMIAGNLISGIAAAPGVSRNTAIYLDQGSTGFTIADNGLYDLSSSAFKFHLAGMNALIGNTMRLNSSNVDAYFFQSTSMEDIPRIGDVVIDPTSPPPAGCNDPVCGEAAFAGLLPAYIASIYADSDGDGVADFEDACENRRPGDIDGDGLANGADVGSFVFVLLGETTSSDAYCAADVDGNSVVDSADVAMFVGGLLGD